MDENEVYDEIQKLCQKENELWEKYKQGLTDEEQEKLSELECTIQRLEDEWARLLLNESEQDKVE